MNEDWINSLPPEVQDAARKAQTDSMDMFETLKKVKGEPYARAVNAGSKLAALTYMAVDLLQGESRRVLPMMAEMANDACIDIGLAIGLGSSEETAKQKLIEFGKDVEAFTKASFVRK